MRSAMATSSGSHEDLDQPFLDVRADRGLHARLQRTRARDFADDESHPDRVGEHRHRRELQPVHQEGRDDRPRSIQP
jgi:hypothetical protein